MQFEKAKPYIKWGIYYLLLLLMVAVQTTPKLFSIFGVKPVLIVPLMICVCMFEEITPSFIFSLMTGFLWDMTSDKLLGFNAIILVCCGTLISLLCVYYLHTKLVNAYIFAVVTMVIQGLLDFFFHFAIWQIEGSSQILVKSILPTALYSIALTVIFFFCVRSISRKLNTVTRV